MEIGKGLEICGLALFLREESVLVVSDLHLGYEEALNRQGYLLPRFQYDDMRKRLAAALEKTDPKTVVLNGDVKHAFSGISRSEWKQIAGILEIIKGRKAVIVKGNHDVVLAPAAEKYGLELRDYFTAGRTYICHGDIIPENSGFRKAKVIIIGHEHPAIGLREKNRVERFKCFLRGKYRDKDLIVMPSFSTVAEGTDITRDRTLSPFIVKPGGFETYIVEKEDVLYFGKVKDLPKGYS